MDDTAERRSTDEAFLEMIAARVRRHEDVIAAARTLEDRLASLDDWTIRTRDKIADVMQSVRPYQDTDARQRRDWLLLDLIDTVANYSPPGITDSEQVQRIRWLLDARKQARG